MDTSLAHDLTVLKLHYLAENFDSFVNSAQGENAEDILKKLVTLELVEKNRRSVERRLQEARLGRFKRMEHFDWNWPKSYDIALLKNIFAGDMVKSEKNLILMGPRGVGKTMIAKNLVQRALDQGYKGRFITAAKLIADLLSADYRLESRLRYYTNLDILAIDEIGYLSFESRAADLLFEVVSRRYEQAPIILTTNLAFKDWPSIFPGVACVSALVDRLIHHCHILPIRGDSYRQKESKDKKDLS